MAAYQTRGSGNISQRPQILDGAGVRKWLAALGARPSGLDDVDVQPIKENLTKLLTSDRVLTYKYSASPHAVIPLAEPNAVKKAFSDYGMLIAVNDLYSPYACRFANGCVYVTGDAIILHTEDGNTWHLCSGIVCNTSLENQGPGRFMTEPVQGMSTGAKYKVYKSVESLISQLNKDKLLLVKPVVVSINMSDTTLTFTHFQHLGFTITSKSTIVVRGHPLSTKSEKPAIVVGAAQKVSRTLSRGPVEQQQQQQQTFKKPSQETFGESQLLELLKEKDIEIYEANKSVQILRSEVQRVTKENAIQKKSLDDNNAKYQALRIYAGEQSNGKAALERRVEDLATKLQTSEAALVRVQQELASKSTIDVSRQAVAKIAELQANAEAIQRAGIQQAGELDECKSELSVLRAQLSEQQTENAKLTENANSCTETIVGLTEANKVCENTITVQQNEITRLTGALSLNETTIKEQATTNETLNQQLADCQKAKTALENQLKQYGQLNNRYLAETDQLKRQIEIAAAQLETAKSDLIKSRSELDEFRTQVKDQYQTALDAAVQTALTDYSKKEADFNATLQRVNTEFQEYKKFAEGEISSGISLTRKVQEDAERHRNMHALLKDKVMKITKDASETLPNTDVYKDYALDLVRADNAIQRLDTLERIINAFVDQINAIPRLRQNIEGLRTRIKELETGQIEEGTEKAIIKQNEETIAKLSHDIEELKNSLSKTNAGLVEARKVADNCLKEKDELSARYHQASEQIGKQKQEALTKLTSQFAEKQQQHEDAVRQLQKRIGDLERENRTLTERLDAKKAQLAIKPAADMDSSLGKEFLFI